MRFEQRTIGSWVGVGATEAERVRFWIRSTPGEHELTLRGPVAPALVSRVVLEPQPGRDGVTSVCFPDDFVESGPLVPASPYSYSVSRCGDGTVIGSGRFETAPLRVEQTPERFALAFTSCHQPFDREGVVRNESLALLNVLDDVLEEEGVKRLVLTGDQIYADSPKGRSLFDARYLARVAPRGSRALTECTAAEVRSLYQQRYGNFWSFDSFRTVQANRATYMSLDDHEVVDNFGSASSHGSAHFFPVREGALDACWDYQALRVMSPSAKRPDSFDFDFEYGPVAAFVMDVRSQRRFEGSRLRIYSDQQQARLEQFLEKHVDKDTLAIVTGVPVVHIPDWLNAPFVHLDRGRTDLSDRWSVPAAHRCRRRLLGTLFDHQQRHPNQRIVLVAGDVHSSSAFELRWEGTPHRLLQLNASALSNLRTTPLQAIVQKAPWLTRRIRVGAPYPALRVRLLPHDGVHRTNPHGGLNVGLMCFGRSGGKTALRLKVIGHDDRARAHRTLYSSVEL